MRESLTTQYKPSLVAISQRNVTSAAAKTNERPPHQRAHNLYCQDFRNKTIARDNVIQIAECGDCAELLVIYSDTAPKRMLPLVVDGLAPPLLRSKQLSPRRRSTQYASWIYMNVGPGFMILGTTPLRRFSSHNWLWYVRTRSIHTSILSESVQDVALTRSYVAFARMDKLMSWWRSCAICVQRFFRLFEHVWQPV
jgi:hypothetical protein